MSQVKLITNLKQLKNSFAVLEWFKQIQNKQNKTFIQFDIETFYASITREIHNKALDWAANFVNITAEERNIILKSKESFFSQEISLGQKRPPQFRCWNGCLIGLFMLSELEKLEANMGVYRDDGLLEANCLPREIEKLKQDIISIYQSNGFRISIDANRKQINFLDVTLDLENEIF